MRVLVRLVSAWLVFAVWLLLPAATAHAEPIGPVVTGGVSASRAVELTSGVYQSTVQPNQDVYFRVHRQWPGSRLWHGVNMITEPGLEPIVVLEAATPEVAEECTVRGFGTGRLPIFEAVGGFRGKSVCSEGDLVLRLNISDIAEGTPFQIVIWEEPRPTNISDYTWFKRYSGTWVDDMPTGLASPVTGGADWQSAPVLADGVYSTEVGNGQVGLFRRRLEFGQYLQVEAWQPGPVEEVELDSYGRVLFFNPFGGEVPNVDFVEGAPTGLLGDSAPVPAGFVSPTVTWRATKTIPTAASLAGDYFFTFDLTSPDLPDVSTINFSLKVVTDPNASTASPVYPVTPAPQPSLIPKAEPAPAVPESSNLVSYVLFGVSGCFAVAGAVLLSRARRLRG